MGRTFAKRPLTIQAFKFYVDGMPDWFMDKVSTNEIILRNCNYSQYSIDDAYCEITSDSGLILIGVGGDMIVKDIHGVIYPVEEKAFNYSYDEIKTKN